MTGAKMATDRSRKGTVHSFSLKYVLTCCSATVAESLTFPIDITKTRLQNQSHKLGTRAYKGFFQTALGIARREGVSKLWKGLPPAVLRHYIYGSRLVFYEYLRENVFKKRADGTFPLMKAIPCGMLAGASAQFLASPMDLVKVRLQMEGKRQQEGHKMRFSGTTQAFRVILREGGVLGMWRGVVPNCQRAALVCLGDLTTYDRAKRFILNNTRMQDSSLTHACSSCCAAVVAATFATPADVVKSRMMTQPYLNGHPTIYTSIWDCLKKAVQNEGLLSLYRGYFPNWMRMGPWSLTFWVTFEKLRLLTNLSSF